MKLARRLGLFACSLGWHRRPFEKEPRPEGVPPREGPVLLRFYCRRCGLVGRLDMHGNLDPR